MKTVSRNDAQVLVNDSVAVPFPPIGPSGQVISHIQVQGG